VHILLRKLDGGDLRSAGRSGEVVIEVLADPSLAVELVAGLTHPNAVVRMRSADALEKVTRCLPGVAQPYRKTLLELLGRPLPKELLWHLLQIAPRIQWRPMELPLVHAATVRALSNSSSIVKACALQAMVELLPQDRKLEQAVQRQVELALASGTPALRARARKLVPLLARADQSLKRTSRKRATA